MKRMLNPLIERSVRLVFGVDVYADAFEKLAMLDRSSRLRAVLRHKIPSELRRHPLLFIHIAKNGGTSIKRALYSADPGHATVRYYDWLAPSLRTRATCFALLRDPAERFLSSFDFLINGGGRDVSIHPAAMRRLAGVKTVDQFLDYLEAIGGDWFKVDTFARPQWWFITDRSAKIAPDHLWVVGDHNCEVAALLAAHRLPLPDHVNRTRRSNLELSRAQRTRVERIYAPDFELHAAVLARPGASTAALGHVVVPQV